MRTQKASSSSYFNKLDLEEKTRKHVTKVFTLLTFSLILMSISAYVDTIIHLSGFITTLAMFASVFFIHTTPKEDQFKRIGGALILSILVGLNLGSYLSLLLSDVNVKR